MNFIIFLIVVATLAQNVIAETRICKISLSK